MSNITEFAAQGVKALEVSGQGSGLSLEEVKGFVSRDNLDTGVASAIVSAMVSRPDKTIMPEPGAEVVVTKRPKAAAPSRDAGISLGGPSL